MLRNYTELGSCSGVDHYSRGASTYDVATPKKQVGTLLEGVSAGPKPVFFLDPGCKIIDIEFCQGGRNRAL